MKTSLKVILLMLALATGSAWSAISKPEAPAAIAAQESKATDSEGVMSPATSAAAATLMTRVEKMQAKTSAHNAAMLARADRCRDMLKAGEIKPGTMSQFKCILAGGKAVK